MEDSENKQDCKGCTYIVSFAETLDQANIVLKRHEESNNQKFVVYVQSKDFGESDLFGKTHKILWEDGAIEYCGIPFMVLGSKVFDCQYGKDRNISTKMKRLSADSSAPYKNPNRLRTTRKYGCTAKLVIKEIASFPDFKINNNTKWKRENASKRLRNAIKERSILDFQRHFVVLVPQLESHSNHPLEQEMQPMEFQQLQPEKKKKMEKKIVKKVVNRAPINLAPGCRALLDDVKALTYVVEEEGNLMRDLHKNLDMIKQYLVTYIQQRELQKTQNQHNIENGLDSNISNNINTVENSVNSTEINQPNHNPADTPSKKKKRKNLTNALRKEQTVETDDSDDLIRPKNFPVEEKTTFSPSVQFLVEQSRNVMAALADEGNVYTNVVLKEQLNTASTTVNALGTASTTVSANTSAVSYDNDNKHQVIHVTQHDYDAIATIVNAFQQADE